jgi:hypothetical protein
VTLTDFLRGEATLKALKCKSGMGWGRLPFLVCSLVFEVGGF